jgi:hypothetical protein
MMGIVAGNVHKFIWVRLGHCKDCIRRTWLSAVVGLVSSLVIFLMDAVPGLCQQSFPQL